MRYQIVDTRRFKDQIGDSVVAIGFRITNLSSQPHNFNMYTQGFKAVTSDNAEVPDTSYEEGGDPRCFDQSQLELHVDAGQSLTPKEQCFMVGAGLKVIEVEFADEDAYNNADIKLTPPV